MTTRRFAEGTTVEVSKSKAEIEGLLTKHGASGTAVVSDYLTQTASVTFRFGERFYRMQLANRPGTLPDPYKPATPETPKGWQGWAVAERQRWVAARVEQSAREVWRRLLLVVKAKLELVAEGGSSVEREFLADMLLPDGRTVGYALESQISEAYATGKPIGLLCSKPDSA